MKRWAIFSLVLLLAAPAHATYIKYTASGSIYDSGVNQSFDVTGSLYISDELFFYLGDKVPADYDIESNRHAYSRFVSGAYLNIGNEYFINDGSGHLYAENRYPMGVTVPELWFGSNNTGLTSNFAQFYDSYNAPMELASMAEFIQSPYKIGLGALFIGGFYSQEYYGTTSVWLTRADAAQSPAPVPEPSTLVLFATGMFLAFRKINSKKYR